MRSRHRIIGALVIAVAAIMLGHDAALWHALSPQQIRGSDYSSTYIAAQTWRAGDGAQIYNLAVQLAGHKALGTPPQALALAYVNPPLGAVLAAPFSLLGDLASYRAFALTQVLLVLLAVVIAVRVAPWPRSTPRLLRVAVGVAAFAGTGTEVVLLQAQWDGLAALGLVLAYAAWRARRPAWAGVAIALSFGLTKPHIALGLVAFLIARGERRATVAAILATLGMVAASLLLVGPHGTLAFLTAASHSEDVSPLPTMLGFNGLVFSNLQGGSLAVALSVVGGAAFVALAAVLGAVSRRSPDRLEVALAGAALLSLLAAPHLLIHDLAILAPCLVWSVARVAAQARSEAAVGWGELGLLLMWLALSYAALVDLGNGSVGPPGRLVPWVLLAGAAAAVYASWPRRAAARRLEPAVART